MDDVRRPDGRSRPPARATRSRTAVRLLALAVGLSTVASACSGSESGSSVASTDTASVSSTSEVSPSTTASGSEEVAFTAEVWADNWFSLSVNGEVVGEDSVPITTERSFNAETIEFTATYPLTIAMVTKDFKEDETGLEYIGTDRQQMGDGGFIAQFTDTDTGKVVATTGSGWRGFVVHRGPLDVSCEGSSDPSTDCTFESTPEPGDWTSPSFTDETWTTATEYEPDAVGAKDGYDTITWDPAASLIWTDSLKQDNTILWRTTVSAP